MNRVTMILAALAAAGLAAAITAAAAPAAPVAPAAPAKTPPVAPAKTAPAAPSPGPAAPAPAATGTAGPAAAATGTTATGTAAPEAPKPDKEGFLPLLSGADLAGWVADDEAKKHWTVAAGVLKADGEGPDLRTEKAYADFILKIDWRMTGKFNGAIYLRGESKAQVTMGTGEAGSGELAAYRRDRNLAAELRKAYVPKTRADRPVGQWNTFVITARGDRVSITLNGSQIMTNVPLPGVAPAGPIILHDFKEPMEYRNIMIKELTAGDEKAEK